MLGARGDAVGLGVGVGVGVADGLSVGVGVADGEAVGVTVADGLADGVGDGVGDAEGDVDGLTDGETDGATDGVAVGTGVLDGAAVGTAVTAVPPLPLQALTSPATATANARFRTASRWSLIVDPCSRPSCALNWILRTARAKPRSRRSCPRDQCSTAAASRVGRGFPTFLGPLS
jgi:hypothetical protein